MRIGLIFGGPSLERGISLNSARTVMDNLNPLGWKIIPFYCSSKCEFYHLAPGYLYSNTPSDFEFKLEYMEKKFSKKKIELKHMAEELSEEKFELEHMVKKLSEKEFVEACQKVDIVFPVIHGAFGEDGKLQELFEENKIPFVGSSSTSCRRMFDKVLANREMEKLTDIDFVTLPNCCIDINDTPEMRLQKVTNFFKHNCAENEKVVVKPSASGSSIGVVVAKTPREVVEHAEYILKNKLGGCAMIEPYCIGREFTVFVLENPNNEPVALVPTEVRLFGDDILTYHTKYLPSRDVEYHCPPRFNDTIIRVIQRSAEKLFDLFEMNDFVRIDGWLLKDGSLIFSDFNPISGMEQNSDMFIQGSRLGFTHRDMLRYIVTNAAQRYGIDCSVKPMTKCLGAQKVRVLFGGETSERQVSLMSGTNVWLQLWNSEEYLPTPYLLTPDHQIWELPYSLTLNYTVEEIQANCETAKEKIINRLQCHAEDIMSRLGALSLKNRTLKNPISSMTIDQFCKEAAAENAFIFIALHGGYGENGELQTKLNEYNLAYNGSDEVASKNCMDKYKTGASINKLKDKYLYSVKRIRVEILKNKYNIFYNNKTGKEMQEINVNEDYIWYRACSYFYPNIFDNIKILIKPQADGCSTGIVCLENLDHLKKYLRGIYQGQKKLSLKTSSGSFSIIELPDKVSELILEPFIVTDEIYVDGLELVYPEKDRCGWIELTVGVLGDGNKYHILSPSITKVQENDLSNKEKFQDNTKENHVLSLVEKFQGGTGVNLTPPPEKIVTLEQIDCIKKKIEKTAKALEIQGYARIDIFFNTKSNQTIVIEANTLPGLTPSTVIYHQALAEANPLNPQAFLSKLVELGISRHNSKNEGNINKFC